MIIRPPTPQEVLDGSEISLTYLTIPKAYIYLHKNYPCMQEALTCEWLIEQGLMPDPMEIRHAKSLSDLDRQFGFWAFEDRTE